jgi:hypothetical protein
VGGVADEASLHGVAVVGEEDLVGGEVRVGGGGWGGEGEWGGGAQSRAERQIETGMVTSSSSLLPRRGLHKL